MTMQEERTIPLIAPFIAQARVWHEEDHMFHTETSIAVSEEADVIEVDINVDLLPHDRTIKIRLGEDTIFTGNPQNDKSPSDALRIILLDLHTLELAGMDSIPVSLIRARMEGVYLD